MLSTRERNSGKPRTSPAVLLVAAAALAAVSEAAAQTALEPIIIEGGSLSGEPVDAAKLGSSVTVITAEELERRQIRNAADALRTVPGVAVGRTGGAGGLSQVRIRGAEGNQVKVIIDGVDVRNVEQGEFDFATLLAADIEQIEVIRGPQSGIYGANALNGVINIVTKKGGAPRVTATAEAGSLNTSYLAVNASAGSDKGYLSVSAARRETDGFNIARSGSEDDGSEQQTVFARGGIAVTDNFRIDAMGRFQSNFTDTDPFDPPIDRPGVTNEREQTLGSVTAELDTFGKAWTHKIFANYLADDFIAINPANILPFTNNGERTRYGYLSTYRANAGIYGTHTFTGLMEQIDESFEGRGLEQFGFGLRPTVAARSATGYSVEWRGAFADSLFLTANIREDDKDAFEDATTYRLTGAYVINSFGTRLHASYGKGITDPTFFEQFGSAEDFKGNPNLTPEESIGWDIGVEQKFLNDRITVDVTYFQANLKSEIASGRLDVDSDGVLDRTVINSTGESERQGVEITASAQLTPALFLKGSYTYLDATDSSTDREEIRRPPHSGSLGVVYSFADGRGKLNADVVYNGKMKDLDFSSFPAPVVTLDDYLLVNVAASYKLDNNIELFGRAENLLDTDYEEVFGYSTAPITAYGGVRVTFEAERPLEPSLK